MGISKKEFEYYITSVVSNIINIHAPQYFLEHLKFNHLGCPVEYQVIQNPETKTQDVHLTAGNKSVVIPFRFDGYPREKITKEDVIKNQLTPGVNFLIERLTDEYYPQFEDITWAEVISLDELREYVKCLVENLTNIRDPEKFDPSMVFRDGPKMVIDIEEGPSGIIARFDYLGTKWGLTVMPLTKISEITEEQVQKWFGPESGAVERITRHSYSLLQHSINK